MIKELIDWFKKNRRDFPWREKPTPYRVWISEVMLQQTRAAVVVPYFERWMELFPDVFSLAKAPLEKVIKAWEGLGYYSRARNIHRAAIQIVENYSGEIPCNKEELLKIDGIGPYTAGAILSFGFKKRSPAVDGNVMRVLSRYFLIEENISKGRVRKKIEEGADAILDPDEPWLTAEALIELGATVCTPKPVCEVCPLQKSCLGKQKALYLPIKNSPPSITKLKRIVLWIEKEGKILVKKGEEEKLMAGLYEFPYFEFQERIWSERQICDAVYSHFQIKVKVKKALLKVTQSFTRYKADLYPFQLVAESFGEVLEFEWIEKEKLVELPFSSGHKRILSL